MDSKWLTSCTLTHNFVDKHVREALDHQASCIGSPKKSHSAEKDGKKSPVLLHALAEQSEDPMVLRNEILQALMAAQETTAALISNAIFLLSRHPEEWHELRQKALELKKKDLNIESLQNMKYLNYVLNESESLSYLNILSHIC